MGEQYAYAVARVRAKEVTLFKKQDLDQILSLNTLNERMSFLRDKGWGNDDDNNFHDIVEIELDKLWDFIKEVVQNESTLELFLCQRDCINLKTAIKAVVMNLPTSGIFVSHGSISSDIIYEAIKDRHFEMLPEYMRNIAKESFDLLLHTNDGQLCDVIIDRATLQRMIQIGVKSNHSGIKEYTELFVASTNIKTAIRSLKMSKSYDFLVKAMAECESIDVIRLAKATTKSLDVVYEYLLTTKYSDAVEYLKKSMSAFEKWCDNFIIEQFKKTSKYDSFTLLPIFSYIFARENEVKAVRMIMVGKTGNLDDNLIRERLRDMYE